MAGATAAPAGEFGLIQRHFASRTWDDARVALGIGDDCALLNAPDHGQMLAISSDMLVEGRHFFVGADAASIGHKTLAVNLSDLAAIGAEPLGFTLSIALPRIEEAWLESFCDGLFALARRASCPLVGGDTTRGPLCLSVTVFGQVPPSQAFRRSGAKVGDDLWISGAVGGAALAVSRRAAGIAVPPGAARQLDWPEPRLKLARALRGLASAAIDVSDGLCADLQHVLTASGCSGARIDLDSLPIAPELEFDAGATSRADFGQDGPPAALRFALDGGDDYELLFTAPADLRASIASLEERPVRIGVIAADVGILLVSARGGERRWHPAGFDHFRT